jgi:hypothetical protein
MPPARAFEELARDVSKGLLNPDLVDLFTSIGAASLASAAAAADALALKMAT